MRRPPWTRPEPAHFPPPHPTTHSGTAPRPPLLPSTDTQPAAVQALYLAGNEIATHTMTHPSYPSAEEVVGARTWLANATGIPEEKINGFRWGGGVGSASRAGRG